MDLKTSQAGWLRGPRGAWLAVTLVAAVATLPFLGKAFHIDDPLYLAVARQILRKPWDPFGAEVLWEKEPETLFDADFNPPLWSYLLAGMLAWSGEPAVQVRAAEPTADGTLQFRAETSRRPEIALHLLESVFVAAAICGLFALGRRFTRWPLAATALVALSPAMLPGQNVMLEGPVMAFWLWAVWCHLRGVERDDLRWTCAAGLLTALAVLTKYTSGLVIVMLAVESIRRRHWRSLWFAAIPATALVLWSLHNWLVYERLHVLVIFSRVQTGERAPIGVSVFESWGRLLATLRVIGSVTALAIPIVVIVARRFGVWAVLGLIAISLGIGWLGEHDMAVRLVDRDGRERARIFPQSLPAHLIAFGSLGAFAIGGLMISCRGSRGMNAINGSTVQRFNSSTPGSDEFILWTWITAVVAFGVLATPFLAVRHLLPGLPPLVWLVLRRLDAFGERGRRTNSMLLAATVTISTAAGFLVAKADYDFAAWYRHVAVDVGSRTVAAGKTLDKNVWFTGHWGWSYYAERAGMRPYLPRRTEMAEGDFLLVPLVQTWQLPPEELFPHLRGAMRPIHPAPPPPLRSGIAAIDRGLDLGLNSLRTVSNEVHLYGSGTFTVPWRFSRQPLDDFGIVEVRSYPHNREPGESAN